jgi:hypothetical protein
MILKCFSSQKWGKQYYNTRKEEVKSKCLTMMQ